MLNQEFISLFNTLLGVTNMALNQGQKERQARIERKLDELITRFDTSRLYQSDSKHIATDK